MIIVVGGAGGVREHPGRPVPRLGLRVDVEVPADRGVVGVCHADELVNDRLGYEDSFT